MKKLWTFIYYTYDRKIWSRVTDSILNEKKINSLFIPHTIEIIYFLIKIWIINRLNSRGPIPGDFSHRKHCFFSFRLYGSQGRTYPSSTFKNFQPLQARICFYFLSRINRRQRPLQGFIKNSSTSELSKPYIEYKKFDGRSNNFSRKQQWCSD